MNLRSFGGEECAADDARIVLIPVPYEQTTTYRKGTAAGPAALLEASTQLELFDEEMQLDPFDEAGIATLQPVQCAEAPDRLAPQLETMVGSHLDAGRIVGCLGGEHSISLGPIRAAAARHDGLGILQIDAHPDLREEYEGTRFGHGCVMRRVLEMEHIGALAQVGLRALSEEDAAVIRWESRVHPFYAFELIQGPLDAWIDDVVDALPPAVYLSLDVDGLDPSIVPGTGTPEPGGLGWWETLALLKAVTQRRKLVAFDLVELLPEPPSNVSEFTAARLILKLIAYLVRRP
ncbi:MAG: agmatinase [Planctomycetota bacterium]|jgi:agmatinase